jgi:hypothetical protein
MFSKRGVPPGLDLPLLSFTKEYDKPPLLPLRLGERRGQGTAFEFLASRSALQKLAA